jgi:thymidine kinase
MGSLELIIGPMFAGKTTELILRANAHAVTGVKAQAFRPVIDTRYASLASHDGLRIPSASATNAADIDAKLDQDTKVIVIDEIQFLDSPIIAYANRWADNGRTVLAAGLHKTFCDEPFPFSDGKSTMYDLIVTADRVDMRQAICTAIVDSKVCTAPASKVQLFLPNGQVAPRLSNGAVLIGGAEKYQPRCRQHYVRPA